MLRPGGRFFFADLRSMDSVTTLREQFNACGLKVEMETDITTNVLTALRLDNARKLELIDAWIPRVFHRPFGVFAASQEQGTTPASRAGSCATSAHSWQRALRHRPDRSQSQGPAPQAGSADGQSKSRCC